VITLSEKLNTLQLKGLRKILKPKTTSIDRNNTNELVYKMANEVANSGNKAQQTKIEPLSDILTKRRQTLLVRVLRRERGHPSIRSPSQARGRSQEQQIEHGWADPD
jgi:hypothetical protein